MKNRILLLLGLLLPLLAYSQTDYRTTQGADGKQIVRKESVPGSRVYDVVVSSLPSDAVRARIAGRVLIPYAPEAAQQFNPAQFGTNKYFSPNYKFSIDFAAGHTRAQRKAYGVNMFNDFAVPEDQRTQYQAGEGMSLSTESGIHDNLEGVGVYEVDLQTYYNKICERMPYYGTGQLTFMRYIIYNIETSNGWSRDSYTGANSHFPSWESSKNKTIKCESDGVVRTLEQLNTMGASFWANEQLIRRANRFTLLLKATKELCPGSVVSLGTAMYQGLPRVDKRNGTGTIYDGACNVSQIGGDAQGNITLSNSRGGTKTYKLSGSPWAAEDFNLGYYYLFNFDISGSDYNDIVVQKKSGTQNYPYLWSKIKTRHIVADEKGFVQLNRDMMRRLNGAVRPFWRMVEPMYEQGGIVDNNFPATFIHAPFAQLQNTIPLGGGQFDTPKVWQEPYLMYSRYIVNRFFSGNDANAGFYLFPTNPSISKGDPASYPAYQHELHTMTALFQARADLQPYEQYFARSSLIEDPEVRLNQAGNWSAYDGTEAYNYDGGVQGVQKPAYIMRYETTSTGWRVLIVGGMNQDWTSERIDLVRAPGGLLNGNMFRVKLRGPAAQVYEFSVSNQDNGQVYEATPVAQTAWEKPGYGGRVGAAVATTPPSSTTTTPPSNPTTTPTGYGGVYAANSTYVQLSELNRPTVSGNYTRSFLDNGTLRLGVNAKAGSVVDFLAWDGGTNRVNSPQWGNGNLDAGRQWMLALYSNPSGAIGQYGEGPYVEAGQSTSQMHAQGEGSIGWNPVQGGDIGENPSYGVTLIHYNDGSRIYNKVQGKQWDMRNILGKVDMHQWINADPNNARAARFHYRVNMFRDDQFTSKFPTARQQEFPCFYTTTALREAYICTGQPYTYADWTQYPYSPMSSVQPPRFSTEPFIAIRDQTKTKGGQPVYVIMYTPASGRVTAGGFNGEGEANNNSNEKDFSANYIASTPLMHLDHDGTYDADVAVFEGTKRECQDWLYAQPRWSGLPEYVFTSASRQGVIYHNCKDQLEKNISNGLVINPTFDNENQGRDMNITLPERWVNGRVVKHLYLKYNITSTTGAMWLRFQKGNSHTDQFFHDFTIIPDGQDHVVDINLENNANWSNQDITQVTISHASNPTYPAVTNDRWKIYYLSYRNLN